jgi:CcmD family protein
MSAGEKYVAAAYLVVFAAVLLYVAIIALKLQRLQRELAELAALARARRQQEAKPEHVEPREAAEVG